MDVLVAGSIGPVSSPLHGPAHVSAEAAAASILERAGFRVLRARDGVEAVEMFRTSSRAVDLLVLDVIMPRLNGRDAYRSMVEGRDPVPVVFCSGYDDAILTRDFLLDTPGELLQKPYRAGDLLERVARAAGLRAREGET